MKIRDLFKKKIDRPINGVIKADQRDSESIWQELDEYVVTKQLTEYFRRFFDAWLAAADNPNDPTISARMGVWVSGFFGSGKSHFIKILSYLLENIEAVSPTTGEAKKAVAFFDEHKIKDPMLLADIQRAVQGSADVILFNIDAKADAKSDRDAILQVFLRVFNEKLGYTGDSPHVAEMERYLTSKGAYETFKTAFQASNGNAWESERDAVDFLRDDVVKALSQALGISEESAAAWFDNARENYRINIEGFAKLIQEYLQTKPKGHRIIFLVDEVGQFIGDNTHLMLSLQTITEQLGTLTQGKAWVIVTSQEDIDAALGEANKAKSQDFSKIQGRFHTRLSLASSNTDEVIGERLLAKTEDAHIALRDLFAQKGDIINNQLAFVGNSVSLHGYRDAAEFVSYYPYSPYQFQLLQKIFESIRRVGATGKHLSRGERSLLDAFQSATIRNSDKPDTALIPLYDFYPSIESFIDTVAKRSIDDAPNNSSLIDFDVLLLKALFLIRYIPDIVKPNIDNLATLCVDEIDADKLTLKRTIQESLARLERERLVSRNGDLWFFLTNEERDVAREIGHVEITASEKTRCLSDLVFDDIFGGSNKVRHRETKADYEFNRLLDGVAWKNATQPLTLEVLTPLNDDYEALNDARCIMRCADGSSRALIKMEEGTRLYEELTLYLQIEKYILSPKASAATPSLKRILADRKEENRERYTRLREQLSQLLIQGDFYALGQKVAIKAANPVSLLDELVNYLITNTYNKLGYLKHRCADPLAEIRAVLAADDLAQKSLVLGGEEGNPQALAEIRQYLTLKATTERVLLSDIVDRFSGIPWGWKPEAEVVLLIARLFMAGEIKLTFEGSDLDPKAAFEPLSKSVRYKQIAILKRKTTDAAILKKAADLYRELFSVLPRADEDGLVADIRQGLVGWQTDLKNYQHTASAKHHPGKPIIDQALTEVAQQLAIRDPYESINTFVQNRDAWRDLADDIANVVGFYSQQLPIWQRMLEALERFNANRDQLIKDDKAAAALKSLEAIRDNTEPYGQISQIEPLVTILEGINEALAQVQREQAINVIDARIREINQKLHDVQADPALRNKALLALQELKTKTASLVSIPLIEFQRNQAGELMDAAMALIEAEQHKAPQGVAQPGHGSVGTGTGTHAGTAPKPTAVIRASELATKSYLESEGEVDAYLTALKEALLEAIRSGQRARIQ